MGATLLPPLWQYVFHNCIRVVFANTKFYKVEFHPNYTKLFAVDCLT